MSELTVIPIETPTLGDRSYLVHDGEVAFVVDPQRDIDRVLALLDEHGVRLTHVLRDPHPQRLRHRRARPRRGAPARPTSSTAPTRSSFDRTRSVTATTVLSASGCELTALATPGHTFTHLSYALRDTASAGSDAGRAVGVFSGGSLLFGATGRPDLLGEEHTDALVRHQHASAHKLADLLPDQAEVFPTHGFGSFCAATQSDATESTIGQEKQTNPVLTQDEETYVRELLDGLGAFPAYYAHMSPANAAGPSAPDLAPPAAADARRAPPAHRGRRVGRRPAQPHRVRRRPRARHPQLRPRRRVRDLPGLADHLGHPRHPARRDRRGRRRSPARAGPDRHRPSRRPGHRRSRGLDRRRARVVPDRHVRRPRAGPPTPPGGGPRRPSRRRARARPGSRARSTSPSTSCPSASTRSPKVSCGCTAPAATAPASPPRSSTPHGRRLVAIDDSFENAEKVGLHLVGPDA